MKFLRKTPFQKLLRNSGLVLASLLVIHLWHRQPSLDPENQDRNLNEITRHHSVFYFKDSKRQSRDFYFEPPAEFVDVDSVSVKRQFLEEHDYSLVEHTI